MELPQYTAALLGGSGQWDYCGTVPHCLGVVGNGTPAVHLCTALGQCRNGTPLMQCRTAWGQWVVELLRYTAALPAAMGIGTTIVHGGTTLGQWAVEVLSYIAILGLRAVGSGTPVVHWRSTLGQWKVELLRYTTALPRGSRQWNNCGTPPHCMGAMGNGTPSVRCRIA